MAKGKCNSVRCRTNSLLHQDIGNQNSEGNNGCPVISILDVNWQYSQFDGYFEFGQNGYFIFGDINSGSITAAGLAPALLSSLDLPSGMELAFDEPNNIWGVNYDGSTPVGNYAVNINGEDANGCTLNTKQYTIIVQAP